MSGERENGGPAFPHPNPDYAPDHYHHVVNRAFGGMSKREYMATACLAGIFPWALQINLSAEGIAHHAVAAADALLLELAKP